MVSGWRRRSMGLCGSRRRRCRLAGGPTRGGAGLIPIRAGRGFLRSRLGGLPITMAGGPCCRGGAGFGCLGTSGRRRGFPGGTMRKWSGGRRCLRRRSTRRMWCLALAWTRTTASVRRPISLCQWVTLMSRFFRTVILRCKIAFILAARWALPGWRSALARSTAAGRGWIG